MDNETDSATVDPADDKIIIVESGSESFKIPNFAKTPDVRWASPRTMLAIYLSLGAKADQAYDDEEELAGRPVDPGEVDGNWSAFSELPRISWRYIEDDFRRKIARAYDDLSSDIEAGEWPTPRSVAEEIVLNRAIAHAEVLEDMFSDGHMAEVLAFLPEHLSETKDTQDDLGGFDGADYDWPWVFEALYQDLDHEFLWQPEMDGFEDPTSDINSRMRIGDYRILEWFKTFSNMDPRDPERGFRRGNRPPVVEVSWTAKILVRDPDAVIAAALKMHDVEGSFAADYEPAEIKNDLATAVSIVLDFDNVEPADLYPSLELAISSLGVEEISWHDLESSDKRHLKHMTDSVRESLIEDEGEEI